MKTFFLRLLFILAVLFFEFSFFDVLFPWTSAPLILLASIVIWSLLIPFPRVLFTTLSLAILFDIVSSGTPGIFSLYSVALVYGTSFLSRRLLVEHQGRGITLYVFFSMLCVFGFDIFKFVFSQGNPFLWSGGTFTLFFSRVLGEHILFSMLFCIPVFIAMYFAIDRFERYMRYVAQGEVLKVR